jgi:hypothetical protein
MNSVPLRITQKFSILFFSIFFLTTLVGSAFAQSIREVVEKTNSSVVTIKSSTGVGSGVLISPEGRIATNYHVVEEGNNFEVVLSDGEIYRDIDVIELDVVRDIAILKIHGFNLNSAALGDSNSLSVGDELIVIGSPKGFSQSVSRGILSAKRSIEGDGYTLFQTDAAISPGSSGGGVFNINSELVGLVVSKAFDSEGVNFFIPLNYVLGLQESIERLSLNENSPLFAHLSEESNALEEYLSRSELTYSLVDDATFVVDFVVEDIEQQVFISNAESWINIFTYPQIDPENITPTLLKEVLKLTGDFLYVSSWLDDDDKLRVSYQLPSSGLRREPLIRAISELANLKFSIELSSYIENYIDEFTYPEISYTDSEESELLELNSGLASLSIDPRQWREFERIKDNETMKYIYELEDGFGFFEIITQPLEVSYTYLEEEIKRNAESRFNASNFTCGNRAVSGNRMLTCEYLGDGNGLSLSFLLHAYSGKIGTFQMLGYGFDSNFIELIPVVEKLVSTFDIK